MNARKTTLTNLCRFLLATIPSPLSPHCNDLVPSLFGTVDGILEPIQRHSNPPLGLDDDCNHQLEPTNHRGILECIPPIQSYCNSLLEMDNTHDHQLDPTSHPSVLECVSPIQSHCNSPLGLECTHDHPLAPTSHPSTIAIRVLASFSALLLTRIGVNEFFRMVDRKFDCWRSVLYFELGPNVVWSCFCPNLFC